MKKFYASIFFIYMILSISLIAEEHIDYSNFNSIFEVIEFESMCISKISPFEYEQLSEAYSSRGESFFLCSKFLEALDDFQKSYGFGLKVEDQALSSQLVFRSLFGQALVYGYLDMPEMVKMITENLIQIIHSIQCFDCEEKSHEAIISPDTFNTTLCEYVPIYGPDTISIQDCVDFIDNTVILSKILISNSPVALRSMLIFTIELLEREAKRCCLAGGLWKGCVQKLMNKFHQWNQKWEVFRIPPDPAWD